jgi:hypothetical protein
MSKICDYLAVFDNSHELELFLEADTEGINIRKPSLPSWLSNIVGQMV